MCLKCFVCFLFLTIVLIQAQDNTCPPNEDIFPCTCVVFGGGPWVTCNKLQGADDFREAVAGFKGRKILALSVRSSHIGDLPGDLFKGAFIEYIYFTDTTLTSFGDKENPPFTGLENSLFSLKISAAFWEENKPLTEPIQLGHLRELFSISLEDNFIPEIGDDFFADVPVSVSMLTISNCHVKKVGDSAFKKMKNLGSLTFSGNSVSLERSAIADNPTSLDYINLSDNGVKEFPNDMFSNMPALTTVDLKKNDLVQLPVSVWKPLLKQLRILDVTSNPLICDERIKELVKENLHKKITGECAAPEKLVGREIESLTVDEM